MIADLKPYAEYKESEEKQRGRDSFLAARHYRRSLSLLSPGSMMFEGA